MRAEEKTYGFRAASLFFTIAILAPSILAQSWNEKPLLEFNNANGADPTAALIFDNAGNLYGATLSGGNLKCAPDYGCGVVFKLTPTSGGGWEETVLHAFEGGSDGSVPPVYSNLIFDAEGNLYGTTYYGGGSTACEAGISGCGTVFELSSTSSGPWEEKILYRFTGGNGGAMPEGGLVFDHQGNLYGTTIFGGGSQNCGAEVGCGVIFELTPKATGPWTVRVLHVFAGAPTGCQNCDGAEPYSTLAFDATGNLYGTASSGGNYHQGTVFELMPSAGGGWNYKTIYSFQGAPDGSYPYAGVVFDGEGNIYGTASDGGTNECSGVGCGTVFKLTADADGWTEATLYNFQGGTDGAFPVYPLLLDATGNLYGSTFEGGESSTCTTGAVGCGTVFELTQSIAGAWTETVLFRFRQTDGDVPQNLIFDPQGNLYSTTRFGGRMGCERGIGCGLVFELTP